MLEEEPEKQFALLHAAVDPGKRNGFQEPTAELGKHNGLSPPSSQKAQASTQCDSGPGTRITRSKSRGHTYQFGNFPLAQFSWQTGGDDPHESRKLTQVNDLTQE